jgi:hypothetical protein
MGRFSFCRQFEIYTCRFLLVLLADLGVFFLSLQAKHISEHKNERL